MAAPIPADPALLFILITPLLGREHPAQPTDEARPPVDHERSLSQRFVWAKTCKMLLNCSVCSGGNPYVRRTFRLTCDFKLVERV